MSDHSSSVTLIEQLAAVRVDDKIRFTPGSTGRRWWTVRARDERFIVATMQAPFAPKGTLIYTVVDLTGWQDQRYNGAGNGVVRSSLNRIGGGWDLTPEGIAQMLPALHSGKNDLSVRRVLDVSAVESLAPKGTAPLVAATNG